MIDEPPFGRSSLECRTDTAAPLEAAIDDCLLSDRVDGLLGRTLCKTRERVDKWRTAYRENPRVNLHANSIVSGLAAAAGVAVVSARLQRYGVPAKGIAAWGVATKEAIVWGLPSLLHVYANRHAFRGEDSFDHLAAAKSVGHYHASSIIPGAIFTAIGATGQWLLQRLYGMDAGVAGALAYGAALLPSRVAHDIIAERSGLYERLRQAPALLGDFVDE